MAKSLGFYRDAIRELRKNGFDGFSAANGYKLSGDLSSGQKSAISRAYNEIERDIGRAEEHEEREERDIFTPTDYYEDSTEIGDWDDIDYFDYDEIEDFTDEEADGYEEGESK